jgi:hypothetical protein
VALARSMERNLKVTPAASPAPIEDQHDRWLRNYQAQQAERTQADNQVAVGHGLAAQRKALYQSELERNLATAAAADRAAIRPSAPTDPAAPAPGVDVGVTLLVGLVGGLVGGAAAMLGWTATTRRRRPRVAAGT